MHLVYFKKTLCMLIPVSIYIGMPVEVMGLMVGRMDGDRVIVYDVEPLPVEGPSHNLSHSHSHKHTYTHTYTHTLSLSRLFGLSDTMLFIYNEYFR